MDLRQLRYFLKIVEFGNMTRAAEALHVAQPALSQQMRNLEEELGVKLFVRINNGVRPTNSALILRTQGRQILRQIEEAMSMVRTETDSPTGDVHIALPSSTAQVMAIPLLQAVLATYPNISVKFIEAPSAGILRLLDAGESDMVIAVDPPVKSAYSTTPLVAERLYVMERGEAGRATQKVFPAAQLAERPLVLPMAPNAIREYLDGAFKRLNQPMNLVAEINATNLLTMAVRAGVGVTVLPLSAALDDVSAGRIVATPLAGRGTVRSLALCTLAKFSATTASVAVQSLVPGVAQQLINSGRWKGARML